MTSIESDT